MQFTRTFAALALASAAFAGCHTPAGKYFAARAADFGDCFRLQVGAGFGVGVSVRTAGNLDLGLSVGVFPRELGIGWDYGTGYVFGIGETGMAYDSEVNLVFAAMMLDARRAGPTGIPPFHWNTSAAAYGTLNPLAATHGCFGIFPALLGWVNARDIRMDAPGERNFWLWSGRAIQANKWEHIHVFDIEATVMAGLVRVSAGFSPGEFVDFVMGWFGVDFARDDDRFEPGTRGRGPVHGPDDRLQPRRPRLRR